MSDFCNDAFVSKLNSMLNLATMYGGDLGGPYFTEKYGKILMKNILDFLIWSGIDREYILVKENNMFKIVKPVEEN